MQIRKYVTLVDLWKKKTNFKAEITDIEGKIRIIAGLATASTLNAVENKIPNVSDIVNKTDHDARISGIETKYFTTSDYNKFTGGTLDKKTK